MKKNKTYIISEKEMAGLLNQTFLQMDFNQPQNQSIMETIANHTLISAALPPNIYRVKFSMSKLLAVLTLTGIISTTVFLSIQNSHLSNTKSGNYLPISHFRRDSTKYEDKIALEPSALSKKVKKEIHIPEIQIPAASKSLENNIMKCGSEFEILNITAKNRNESTYIFPVLDEKQIKANEKQKRKMVKMITQLDKKKYSLATALTGSTKCTFYIQTTEVSNLEYRTFLFDLLIQGKKEDFLKAKPDQDLWTNVTGTDKFNYLKDVYFAGKEWEYDGYPVVNISVEGAEMYCKWLTDLLSVNLKDVKLSDGLECRLPYENEWISAAKAGKQNAIYPWGKDSIQNGQNCFFANFCVQKLKEKIKQPIECRTDKINLNAYTSAGLVRNNDSMATAHAYSYCANAWGLYCMSGNVSELVYDDNTKNIKTKGGNWASDFEHLKIDSEDEFKGNVRPSPMIGFRVVVNVKK
jgi:formylglycine-generating enzyme required for sulfatase activity